METKSGIKTTEFWLTLAVAILSVVAPTLANYYGEELPEWAKLVSILTGSALAVLATLGYTKARSEVKSK